MQPALSPLRCDGCGARATVEHIRARIERLELATRFRPIHIGVLFLSDAPPASLADYFYRPDELPGREGRARLLFEELLAAVGVVPHAQESSAQKDEESRLALFQSAGFFLADCVECPLEESAGTLDPADLARRFGPTVVNRVLYSYRPRNVVLLSRITRGMIPIFEQDGLGERLLLHEGGPFELPAPGDREAQERFRSSLGETVRRAVARLR